MLPAGSTAGAGATNGAGIGGTNPALGVSGVGGLGGAIGVAGQAGTGPLDHGGLNSIGGGGGSGLGAAPGCTLYAAPAGAGQECSAEAPCSLFGARDKVRTLNQNMSADLNVCLAGGVYALSEPFTLLESPSFHDSGTNGFNIIYRPLNTERPVLSGGRVVTGFVLHDADKNIFRAKAAGLQSRQLFVNGKRAQRARSQHDMGMHRADHGFDADTAEMALWKNPRRIELTGVNDWRHYRCPVESISGNHVRLQSPCWELTQDIGWEFASVAWVENAYELLDAEGEFYLDEATGQLFYKPRQGEDLTQATVVVPVLETIVSGRGAPGAPLRNIVFRGLAFAHGTWTEVDPKIWTNS